MNHRISRITFEPIFNQGAPRDSSSAFVSFVLDDLIFINNMEVSKYSSEHELSYPTFQCRGRKVLAFKPVNGPFEDFLKQEIFRAYDIFLQGQL